MQFLAVGIDVAIARIDVTPLLFCVGLESRLIGLLAARAFVLGRHLRLLGFLLNIRVRSVRKESGQSHQLSMTSSVASDVGGIHAPGNNSSIMDENTSYGCLVGLQRQAGLRAVSHDSLLEVKVVENIAGSTNAPLERKVWAELVRQEGCANKRPNVRL